MSLFKNIAGLFVPVREQRRSDNSASPFAISLAELVHDLNGDESAIIFLNMNNFNASIDISASPDGTNYLPIMAFPLAATGGTIPILSRPLLTEAFAGVSGSRAYAVQTTGMRKLRIRVTPYTSGSAFATINSDPNMSIHPQIYAKALTDTVTATGAAGAAVTASLPAVAGLRHYVQQISVIRNASAVLVAGAAPVNVTTTNLPGSPVLSFGADAAAQGVDKELKLEYGEDGLAASAINTASSVACPLTTGVIWRVNVAYRLGL